jgi:hypothetical protein
MSCTSKDSCSGFSPLTWLALLLVGAFLLLNSKEIIRYIKISSM